MTEEVVKEVVEMEPYLGGRKAVVRIGFRRDLSNQGVGGGK